MKSLFIVGTCALRMLWITLYIPTKTYFFFSSLYGCANRISGLLSWIWMGNGKKKAFQKCKCSRLQTERLPGTLYRMVFSLLLHQLCSEWKHPSPRDQKHGDDTRQIRNEWCPNYGLDFWQPSWSQAAGMEPVLLEAKLILLFSITWIIPLVGNSAFSTARPTYYLSHQNSLSVIV